MHPKQVAGPAPASEVALASNVSLDSNDVAGVVALNALHLRAPDGFRDPLTCAMSCCGVLRQMFLLFRWLFMKSWSGAIHWNLTVGRKRVPLAGPHSGKPGSGLRPTITQ